MTASAQQFEQAGRLTLERPRRIAPVRRAAGEKHQQPERGKQAPARADTHPFVGSGLEITERDLGGDLAVAVNRQVLGEDRQIPGALAASGVLEVDQPHRIAVVQVISEVRIPVTKDGGTTIDGPPWH